MDFFSYLDYKDLINDHIKSMPAKGRGQYQQIAKALKSSTVSISHIFKGTRHLNPDKAFELCEFFHFGTQQTDYFLLLVNFAHAGTKKLQNHFLTKINLLQKEASELKNRLPQDIVLTDEIKAKYYSHWSFAATRVASSLSNYNTPADFAKRLGLSIDQAMKVCDFLLQQGLLVRDGANLGPGPAHLHLEADSPFIRWRQIQWRLKGFTAMENTQDKRQLFFTAPLSISETSAKSVRNLLLENIEKINAEVARERPSELYCLNIDWFLI